MKHFASSGFWNPYNKLPKNIQELADKNFELLKADDSHPSLHFKKIGNKYRSVRIGINYRALGMEVDKGVLWFWIGSHPDYDKLVS